jgi:hypothetical protein
MHSILSIRQGLIASSLVAQRIPRPGTVFDEFEAADFGDHRVPNTAEETRNAHANQAWAKKMRERASQRGLETGIVVPKFESKRGLKLPKKTSTAILKDAVKGVIWAGGAWKVGQVDLPLTGESLRFTLPRVEDLEFINITKNVVEHDQQGVWDFGKPVIPKLKKR